MSRRRGKLLALYSTFGDYDFVMLTTGPNKDDLSPLSYQSIARSPGALTTQRQLLGTRLIAFSEGLVWSTPNDSNGSALPQDAC